jgi:trehalose 6-phosphate synthase
MSRIFIISNRVAVPSSDRAVHPGGLEVALRALLSRNKCVWMGWSGRAVDDAKDLEVHSSRIAGTEYVVTDLLRQDYEEYYNGFANRVLWPVLHYRQDLAEFSRRDLSGYLRVNTHFADLLSRHLKPDDVVWVHDYHLMPLAQELRARGHHNRIGFFLHIPMPPPEVVAAMPHHERVLGALSSYDLVGFQTEDDTANFARYVAKQFGTSPHLGSLASQGMRIGTFPVGIETQQFQRMAKDGAETKVVRTLRERTPNLVIGVDRLDYSKGLELKFEAYQRFLQANTTWCDRATFLQITPKSRSAIAEYAAMEQSLDALSGRINSAFGNVLWTPIRYVTRAYGRDILAGLFRVARVGVVTPLRDGMNLVAKEYIAAQDEEDPGVLILSKFAGAAAELGSSLLVNPNDPEAVASALLKALTMPLSERRERHAACLAALFQNDIAAWGEKFIGSLTTGRSRTVPSAALAAE